MAPVPAETEMPAADNAALQQDRRRENEGRASAQQGTPRETLALTETAAAVAALRLAAEEALEGRERSVPVDRESENRRSRA